MLPRSAFQAVVAAVSGSLYKGWVIQNFIIRDLGIKNGNRKADDFRPFQKRLKVFFRLFFVFFVTFLLNHRVNGSFFRLLDSFE